MTHQQQTPVELWLQALESGKYQQGKGALHNKDSYCCLGVACDIYNQLFPGELVVEKEDNTISYDGVYGVLPGQVQAWLELNTVDGAYGPTGGSALSNDNDRGKTFQEIAEIIRSRPKGLFKEEDEIV